MGNGDQSRAENTDKTDSRIVFETEKGSHIWVIKGYSLTKGMGMGKYVASDTFSVGGYDWQIYFYPDGKKLHYCRCMSVYITLVSEVESDVRALFEVSLLDQSGKNHHVTGGHFTKDRFGGPVILERNGSMWGYNDFIRKHNLEYFLKDDCLKFRCTVAVVKRRMERPKHYKMSVPPSDMGKQFKEFLESGNGCDIVFHVGNEVFKAQKLILAARSPVFEAQFFGLGGDPNMDEVTLEDVEPSIFKIMLLYIYSDSLPDLCEITASNSSSSVAIVVQHLLAAADRFGLERLKSICESKLSDEITVETVATTLSLAEQHRCNQLKSACLKFAAANLNAVMLSDGYKYLEQGSPSLISELLQTAAALSETPSLTRSKRKITDIIIELNSLADAIPALDPGRPVDCIARRLRSRFR